MADENPGDGGGEATPDPLPPAPSTDTAPVTVTWADTANGFLTESYNTLLTLSGVILSITMLSVGAGIIIQIFRRAGREGGG